MGIALGITCLCQDLATGWGGTWCCPGQGTLWGIWSVILTRKQVGGGGMMVAGVHFLLFSIPGTLEEDGGQARLQLDGPSYQVGPTTGRAYYGRR